MNTITKSLTANGSTDWVQLGPWGNRVEVRSASFSSPSTTAAKLEFSTDKNGTRPSTLEEPTANDAWDLDGPGYVRLTATNVNTSIELLVTPKARP